MKITRILSILTILCVLGIGLLACGDTSTNATSNGKAINISTAFEEVVEVLHAPYVDGDMFFGFNKSTAMLNESKQGSEDQIGKGTDAGSGSWSVLESATDSTDSTDSTDKSSSIVYEYNAYKPQGSAISVTGSMGAMYRSQTQINVTSDAADDLILHFIGFNQSAAPAIYKYVRADENFKVANQGHQIYRALKAMSVADTGNPVLQDIYEDVKETYKTPYKTTLAAAKKKAMDLGLGQHIDTLTISGAYDAKLTFTYKNTCKITPTVLTEYNAALMGKLFKNAKASVAFTYKDETITLNKLQLKKLLFCVAK